MCEEKIRGMIIIRHENIKLLHFWIMIILLVYLVLAAPAINQCIIFRKYILSGDLLEVENIFQTS